MIMRHPRKGEMVRYDTGNGAPRIFNILGYIDDRREIARLSDKDTGEHTLIIIYSGEAGKKKYNQYLTLYQPKQEKRMWEKIDAETWERLLADRGFKVISSGNMHGGGIYREYGNTNIAHMRWEEKDRIFSHFIWPVATN